MARVVLKNVSKEYPGGVQAVRGVSLEVADREFVVLVGPSGCGKTTLLRMIAGLEEISRGTIMIGERTANDLPPRDRDVAMVFQSSALYPHMTVAENLAFALKLRRVGRAAIGDRVRQAARVLGLLELLDRKPHQLSGGQRQRVALGRTMVRRPAVFLFDEPLSNLDARLRVDLRVELKKLHRRLAATMIYVTHDQVEAMTLANRIAVMNQGVIHQVADPLTVYHHPVNEYVGGFIGSPPMNFIEGSLLRTGGGVAFSDGAAIRVPLPARHAARLDAVMDRAVKLGIRPEMIGERASMGDGPLAAVVTATVDVVEPLGDQQLVYFSAGRSSFVGKLNAQAPVGVGQELEIVFHAGQAHVFDAQSGQNLTAGVVGEQPPAARGADAPLIRGSR